MFLTLVGLATLIYFIVVFGFTLLIDSDIELWFYEKFGKTIGHLQGKVVFITGASSGIGEHLAKAFAKYGVKLVLAARREEELERVKRQCLETSSGKLSDADVLVMTMDMLDVDSHQDRFARAVEHFGGVDILINNAGRSQRAMWENISLSVDKQMFELNVFSVLNLTRVAIEHFKERGRGHVAVTSSVAGIISLPYSATYVGSKYALHGYFNALRTEKLGRNISVTILCPGPTFTNFLQESFTEKEGEKYGIPTQPTDKRMTGERCGELCALAIANEQEEAWMALPPLMSFNYYAVYLPNIFKLMLKVRGTDAVFKFRDSRDTSVPQ